MHHYENPVFPQTAGMANVAPAMKGANVAHAMKCANVGPAVKGANVGPVGGYHGHCYHGGGLWTTTGVILVLFILLVIVSRAWSI